MISAIALAAVLSATEASPAPPKVADVKPVPAKVEKAPAKKNAKPAKKDVPVTK